MPSKQRWWGGKAFSGIPIGGIIGLNAGASLPAGYSYYDTNAGRLIMASATANTLAGSTTIASVSSDAGNSVHGAGSARVFTRTPGGTGALTTAYSRGGHGHTVTFTHMPKRADMRLIQATSDKVAIPQGGVIFAAQSSLTTRDSSLATHNDQDAYLTHGTATQIVGASSSASSSTESFYHVHHDNASSTATCGGWDTTYTGTTTPSDGPAHSHSCSTPSYSVAVKAAVLKAFVRATAHKEVAKSTIIMFEGTVPTGWLLCDGSNGTVNLMGYCILLSSNGTLLGTYTSASNTISGSTSLAAAGSHAHPIAMSPTAWWMPYGHNEYYDHYHSCSFGTTAFTPYTRTLKFIQYKG